MDDYALTFVANGQDDKAAGKLMEAIESHHTILDKIEVKQAQLADDATKYCGQYVSQINKLFDQYTDYKCVQNSNCNRKLTNR